MIRDNPIPPSTSDNRRRSERSKEAIRTKHLRRISELFWDADERYHANPCDEGGDDAVNNNTACNKSFGRLKLERIHRSPHIYTIDNFLTESELLYLKSRIELAERNNYFKTSIVDVPTTTLLASQLVSKNKKHDFNELRPGERVMVLWAVDDEEGSYNHEQNDDELRAKEFKPWGATVMKPITLKPFTITKDTPGITKKDFDFFRHLNQLLVFTLKYDLYTEAGYDQHTYCDVVFLSEQLLYDITSQGMCKYTVTPFDDLNNNDDSDCPAISQCCLLLLSDDDEEDATQDLELQKQISFHTTQRTSSFIHFSKSHHTKITSIETRAAELLGIPTACVEPIQLVRYGLGDCFQAHHDLGTLYEDGSIELPPSSILLPPRRLVTIFVYVNDVPKEFGGATRFPLLLEQQKKQDIPNGVNILEIQPKRGMALLFCNVGRNGLPEPLTVHSGEPLTSLSPTHPSRTRSKSSVGNQATVIDQKKILKYGINIWACER